MYIFLDIDGVLNGDQEYSRLRKHLRDAGLLSHKQSLLDLKPEHAREEHLLMLLSGEKISLLNELIQKTGAEIILSSTWRNSDNLWGFEAETLLKKAGFQGKIAGKTGESLDSRGAEIARKIKSMALEDGDYIILDDDPTTKDARLLTGSRNRWIRTATSKGLTPRHLSQALDLLAP